MVVKLCHRLSRAAWCYGWERKATAAFAELDESASDLERAETAIAMLWPLARRVFLMHRVDDLSYSEISEIVGIDVMTVEICIFDALVAISGARRGHYVERALNYRGLKEALGYGRR